MTEEHRNLFAFAALSLALLIGWNYFFGPSPLQSSMDRKQSAPVSSALLQEGGPNIPTASIQDSDKTGVSTGGEVSIQADHYLSSSPNEEDDGAQISIDTPQFVGSLSLKGGVIDNLSLKKYHETVDPRSSTIRILSPRNSKTPYYVAFGWSSAGKKSLLLPDLNTRWTADREELTPTHPVRLTWDNGQGLIFTRTIHVDNQALFTITDKVKRSAVAVSQELGDSFFTPYAMIVRRGKPHTEGFFILHEGLIGVLGAHGLQEEGYDALQKEPVLQDGRTRGKVFGQNEGGFIGVTDKYWATALIPDQKVPYDGRFLVTPDHRGAEFSFFQTDLQGQSRVLNANASEIEHTVRFFAGPKAVSLLKEYQTTYGIKNFDLLIDWGWFYFITKPMFWLLELFSKITGNFGVAILIVTVLIKGLFFPLANRSYLSMARMKAIQPQILALRERYASDSMKQQQAFMELYKREKINPLAGCWPMFIQVPFFFALYKVLFITIEMRHAPFFGWINDLSAPDPTSLFNAFGFFPWNPATLPVLGGFMMVGLWPIFMGISMWVQMRLNPSPADPIQKAFFSWMPVIFTFMLASFPAGLVIYWTWNNLISIAQQCYIMHINGNRIELWDNVKASLKLQRT
jgi:YidC/Oxa1 family membrane protein insertase